MKNRFDNLSPLQKSLGSVGVLLLLTLLFFWRVPVQGRVLLPLDVLYTYEPWRSEIPGALGVRLWNPSLSDGVRQFYPVLTVVQSAWKQGQLPFWNPHAATGMPILAAGLHQALYPFTIFLLLLMPVAYAISWGIILHTFLAGLFCFLFMRELGVGHFGALFGATAFMFSGSLVIIMSSLGRFPTIIWLPLLLWSLERALKRNWRWAIVGGLILGMQILAGHVQMVLYSVTTLGLYAAYRVFWAWFDDRNFRRAMLPGLFLGIILPLGLGLAAFQLLPMAELLPKGVRSEVDFETEFSPRLLLRLVTPDILGTDIDRNLSQGFSHEVYVYLGLFSLFFIIASLFSPQRRLVWGLVGAGILIWLVIFKVPPLYQLFENFYPSFKTLGFHRTQILIAFFWAITAGLGADYVLAQCPAKMIKALVLAGEILLTVIGIYTLGLAFVSKYQARFMWAVPSLEDLEPEADYLLGSLIFTLAILLVCTILLWAWQQQKINRFVFAGAALSVLVVDLFLANMDYNSAFDPALLYPQTSSLESMQNLDAQETQPYRFMSAGRLFWGDMATVFSLNDIQGYDSFLLKRYSQYVDLTGARQNANFRIAAFIPRASKWLDALNVKYYYVPRNALTEGDWVSLLHQVDRPMVQSPHSYAGQTAEWIIKGWPQEVLLAPTSSKISYRGFLPTPMQLETAIAIDPEAWNQPGVDVLFEIYAHSAAAPTEKLLFSKRLTQIPQPEAMNWTPVGVDLSDFTNQEVIVSFVTSSNNAETIWNAGWADPLIVDNSKVELLHYGPNSIYLNKDYLPRAWVVHQVTQVTQGDLEAVEAVLASPDFDLAEQAAIEGTLSEPLSPKIKDEPVEFIIYTPSYSKLTAELATPGLLTMSDIYYPGWKVYVDGVERLLYATNLVMRGVYVPDGTHTIEFVYEPLSYKIGLYTSLGTVALVAIPLILDWRLKRRNNQAEDCR